MTITFTIPETSRTQYEMKVDINPRGNGIEWEKYIDRPYTVKQKVYIPMIDGLQLGVVYDGETSHVSILVNPITNKPMNLSEHDAKRVYDYIGQLIDQWHPNSLERGGYVNPVLNAAKHNYTLETVALKPYKAETSAASLVTGGGGGGGGNNRKSRKTRKSRKSRKARK